MGSFVGRGIDNWQNIFTRWFPGEYGNKYIRIQGDAPVLFKEAG